MSRDQMTDVFPVIFDFKKGESVTSEKLTGFVKVVDVAFGDITRAVGDPWDSKSHVFNGESEPTSLSLEKLSQTSLSRIIGPSDYLSPHGSSFNESTPSSSVRLSSNRNSWNVGYPLVKLTSDVTESSTLSGVSNLEWGVDITIVSDPSSCLVTEVDSLEEVVEDGDFYIDYKKGTIVSYKPTSSSITLLITDMNVLSAGAPWTTHNVIPTWQETTNLCSLSLSSDDGTTAYYTLSFPLINSSSRSSNIGQVIYEEGTITQARWTYSPTSSNAEHQLPTAITSSSIQVGEEIPDGYILLWSETQGRVVPLVSFLYRNKNSVTVRASSGALTVGSSYRLLTSGSSVSENLSYLLCQQRFGQHNGLNTYSSKLGFSIPLSHSTLEDLYTGDINSIDEDIRASFKFRKSSYPTNHHSQYLHRAGYLPDDEEGNSSNAMRGILGFTGVLKSDGSLPYHSGTISSGNRDKTYGIYWGGPSSSNSGGNTRMFFDGGVDNEEWVDNGSSGRAYRIPSGLDEVGLNPLSSRYFESYGALSLYPWSGTPLYLRGVVSGPSGSEGYFGGAIAFDQGWNSEVNYLKLLSGYRISATYDKKHLPAQVNQDWSVKVPCMPGVNNPVHSSQIRELRFRGVSYVPDATNVTTSIGGSVTRDDDNIEEFEHYYTSPGILGSDFINVYSNAIFFSDAGDGKSTDFTTNSYAWLNDSEMDLGTYYSEGTFNSSMPIGMYYLPYTISNGSHSGSYLFSVYSSGTGRTQPLVFGERSGFEYVSNHGGDIRFSTRENGIYNGGILLASGSTSKDYFDDLFHAGTDDFGGKIELRADEQIKLLSSGSSYFLAETTFSILSQSSMTLNAPTLAINGSSYSSEITNEVACVFGNLNLHTQSASSSAYQATIEILGSSSDTIQIKTTDGDYPISSGAISLVSKGYLTLITEDTSDDIELKSGVSRGIGNYTYATVSSDRIILRAVDGSSDSTLTVYDDSIDVFTGGNILLSAEGSVRISPTSQLVINYLTLPSSDPSVAGAVYRSGSALMISAG